MFKGFKDFIARGSVIDLAVAVVIGAAFSAVVDRVVDAVINPAIGALFQADSLDNALTISIPTLNGGSADLAFGAVIGALIQFLIVALFVYYAIVVPMNKLQKPKADEPAGPSETELLTEIRDLLAAKRESK